MTVLCDGARTGLQASFRKFKTPIVVPPCILPYLRYMCYHTSLDTDVATLQTRMDRQMLEETRGQLPFPRTIAFARPWWPVVTAGDPPLAPLGSPRTRPPR